jgi:hypothetical protein
MTDVALFRGGQLLSTSMLTGDLTTPLSWRCGLGHAFTGSPRLVLIGGHWCPVCVRDTAGYERQAQTNQFLAQLYITHTRPEPLPTPRPESAEPSHHTDDLPRARR